MKIRFGAGLDAGVSFSSSVDSVDWISGWDSADIGGLVEVYSSAVTQENPMGVVHVSMKVFGDSQTVFRFEDDGGQVVALVSGSVDDQMLNRFGPELFVNRFLSGYYGVISGNDVDFVGSRFADTVNLGSGHHSVYNGAGGDDHLSTYGGMTLMGGAGNDALYQYDGEDSGDSGKTMLIGGAGDDFIFAKYLGNVGISGGRGDDTIEVGGFGKVRASGGLGADQFIIRDYARLTIAGYNAVQDDILVSLDRSTDAGVVSHENGNTLFTFGWTEVLVLNRTLELSDITVEYI